MKKMNLTNEVANKRPSVLNPEKLTEVQSKTYEEMLLQLMTYGECNLERPTGFGKTKLFMQFASDYPQEKILYVYDVQNVIDDITKTYAPSNVVFLSYASLSRLTSRDAVVQHVVHGDYFAIIFDESHLMGGENIRGTIKAFLPILKAVGCKRLGGTATPIRTDGHNVTAEFFGGHTVYQYTVSDAINDGIMLEPYYCLMLGQQQRLEKLREDYKNNPYTVKRINQLEHAYADRIGAPKIYRDVITEINGDTLPDYMRFIAYYPTIQSAKDNAEKLQADLKKAFPDYGVGVTYITSDAEHDKTISHLDEQVVDGTVDLVVNVNMLNQAYHSPYLTGIMMLRLTWSNIIFTQEYGRACNVASRNRVAVFDNVGNAFVRPFEELPKIFGSEGESDGKGGWVWTTRDHRNMKFRVSAEQLKIEQVLQRITATAGVTEEFKEKAKKLMGPLFNAPDEAVVKMTRLPLWFVQDLRKEMEAEMKDGNTD